ncbi:MAG TPA: methyltransferase domain-containing protein [Chthoniobacterales bacterium]
MKGEFRSAAKRYSKWRSLYFYSRGKIALDPAYPEVARRLRESPRPLMDLGCGMGLLAACLRAVGHRPAITGMDIDRHKIQLANTVLAGERTDFRVGSALDFPEHSGDVVMLDVLHYFEDGEQQRLLKKIAGSIAPGGVAFVRLTLNEPTWRFAMTRIEEQLIAWSGWIPDPGHNFPTRDELERPFIDAGLDVTLRPMWGVTPFNSYMLEAVRIKR